MAGAGRQRGEPLGGGGDRRRIARPPTCGPPPGSGQGESPSAFGCAASGIPACWSSAASTAAWAGSPKALPVTANACTASTLIWSMNPASSDPKEPGRAIAPVGMDSTAGLPPSVTTWPTQPWTGCSCSAANSAAIWVARTGAPGSPATSLATGPTAAARSPR